MADGVAAGVDTVADGVATSADPVTAAAGEDGAAGGEQPAPATASRTAVATAQLGTILGEGRLTQVTARDQPSSRSSAVRTSSSATSRASDVETSVRPSCTATVTPLLTT